MLAGQCPIKCKCLPKHFGPFGAGAAATFSGRVTVEHVYRRVRQHNEAHVKYALVLQALASAWLCSAAKHGYCQLHAIYVRTMCVTMCYSVFNANSCV